MLNPKFHFFPQSSKKGTESEPVADVVKNQICESAYFTQI